MLGIGKKKRQATLPREEWDIPALTEAVKTSNAVHASHEQAKAEGSAKVAGIEERQRAALIALANGDESASSLLDGIEVEFTRARRHLAAATLAAGETERERMSLTALLNKKSEAAEVEAARKYNAEQTALALAEAEAIAADAVMLSVRMGRLVSTFPEAVFQRCGEHAGLVLANAIQERFATKSSIGLLKANHHWSPSRTSFQHLAGMGAFIEPVTPPEDWNGKT